MILDTYLKMCPKNRLIDVLSCVYDCNCRCTIALYDLRDSLSNFKIAIIHFVFKLPLHNLNKVPYPVSRTYIQASELGLALMLMLPSMNYKTL